MFGLPAPRLCYRNVSTDLLGHTRALPREASHRVIPTAVQSNMKVSENIDPAVEQRFNSRCQSGKARPSELAGTLSSGLTPRILRH
jgi:hypothetical protein